MAIDPTVDVTQTITTSAQKTLRKSDMTSVQIQPDPDGNGRAVVATIMFADGTIGRVQLKFKDIGSSSDRQAVKDWLKAAHVAAATAAGFTG